MNMNRKVKGLGCFSWASQKFAFAPGRRPGQRSERLCIFVVDLAGFGGLWRDLAGLPKPKFCSIERKRVQREGRLRRQKGRGQGLPLASGSERAPVLFLFAGIQRPGVSAARLRPAPEWPPFGRLLRAGAANRNLLAARWRSDIGRGGLCCVRPDQLAQATERASDQRERECGRPASASAPGRRPKDIEQACGHRVVRRHLAPPLIGTNGSFCFTI